MAVAANYLKNSNVPSFFGDFEQNCDYQRETWSGFIEVRKKCRLLNGLFPSNQYMIDKKKPGPVLKSLLMD